MIRVCKRQSILSFVDVKRVYRARYSAITVPDIKKAIENKEENIKGYVIGKNKVLDLTLSNLTDDERAIILSGCLINFNKR